MTIAPRILVADDDPTVRLLADAALRAGGYQVDCVADGTAALAALRGSRYDLALLDVDMPGRDGYLVCSDLRQEQPALPVVLVTGHDDRDAITAAFTAGAVDFIAKPVDWNALAGRVRAVLARTGGTRPAA